jgi:hypothetical protein
MGVPDCFQYLAQRRHRLPLLAPQGQQKLARGKSQRVLRASTPPRGSSAPAPFTALRFLLGPALTPGSVASFARPECHPTRGDAAGWMALGNVLHSITRDQSRADEKVQGAQTPLIPNATRPHRVTLVAPQPVRSTRDFPPTTPCGTNFCLGRRYAADHYSSKNLLDIPSNW